MKRIAVAVLAVIALVSCQADADPSPTPGTPAPTIADTNAPLPTLEIVTRTPVDPSQIPPSPTTPAGEIVVPESYVVQDGDSLYSIANEFRLDLAEIVSLNGLSDPNDIVVGQELRLPVRTED